MATIDESSSMCHLRLDGQRGNLNCNYSVSRKLVPLKGKGSLGSN